WPPLHDVERGNAREATARALFRAPGYPWTPALFVLAALYVVASAVLANPRNALIGTGLLLLGVPVYGVFRRVRRGGRALEPPAAGRHCCRAPQSHCSRRS